MCRVDCEGAFSIDLHAMAHGFVKQMLENESRRFHLQVITCLMGGFFLFNSYLASFLFDKSEYGDFCALPAALFLGTPLVFHALKDLWDQRLEMNELAALSFIASFSTGEYRVAAFIALFMIVSTLIEYRSQLGARKNLEALLRLSPSLARIKSGNSIEEIDISRLKAGDIVQVRPGDRIPGDGVVCEGFSTVNEATITGESIPVEKNINDSVYSGTINLSGILIIRITADGDDSTLSKIQEMIVQAEQSKTPVMRLINTYIAWYTPVILMLAGIVLFFTRDLDRAISMLIIACPCTILLSSPTALISALSAAARLGVIIKNVVSLEIADKITTIVFDKTGTLTTGILAVKDIHLENGVDEHEVLNIAAGLEQYSSHPVAKAVIDESSRRNIIGAKPENFEERPGFGVKGAINNVPLAVGRREWIEEQTAQKIAVTENGKGTSRLYVSRNNEFIGTIEFSDYVKPEAGSIITELKKEKIAKIIMLTGDHKEPAERVAAQLGCEVKAEVLPYEKMTTVMDIKREGDTVAVVGDGVNDAPALAAGDLSIAMGAAGSDVAIHSASIVLMNDNLNRIPFIMRLSHRVTYTIRQNLVFSILYILTLFALSAGGFISPVLAVILHTFSSVFVVFNSARLLRVGEELT
ncbi:MAG: cadmium-translocating P-type ATPase [Chitinivibrionales bacterium]|nr:cadmium-translocating P-type ATPase [Chitinivibrionales bacterium]